MRCMCPLSKVYILFIYNFTDGQKILSLQISKEVAKIRVLLQDYNYCRPVHNITIAMALDPSVIVKECDRFGDFDSRKHQMIEAYLTICPSKEEFKLLKGEACNVVQFYSEKKLIMDELMLRARHSMLELGVFLSSWRLGLRTC